MPCQRDVPKLAQKPEIHEKLCAGYMSLIRRFDSQWQKKITKQNPINPIEVPVSAVCITDSKYNYQFTFTTSYVKKSTIQMVIDDIMQVIKVLFS